MFKNTLILLLALQVQLFSVAYQEGDFIVRMGVAQVDPDVDSDYLTTDTAGVNSALIDNEAKVDVDDDFELYFTFTYMLSNHFGVELIAATPFDHTISIDSNTTGSLSGALKGEDLAEVTHLPPTLLLQYYPMSAESDIQPYVGVGINYTVFFSEDITATHASLSGLTDIELDDSIGAAVQIGLDYNISENYGVNLFVMWVDIDTTAEVDGTLLGASDVEVDVELDPIVAGLGFYAKF